MALFELFFFSKQMITVFISLIVVFPAGRCKPKNLTPTFWSRYGKNFWEGSHMKPLRATFDHLWKLLNFVRPETKFLD